ARRGPPVEMNGTPSSSPAPQLGQRYSFFDEPKSKASMSVPEAARASTGLRQAGHGTGVSSTRSTYCFCRSAWDSNSLAVMSSSRLGTSASFQVGVSDGLDGGQLELLQLVLDVGPGPLGPAVGLQRGQGLVDLRELGRGGRCLGQALDVGGGEDLLAFEQEPGDPHAGRVCDLRDDLGRLLRLLD